MIVRCIRWSTGAYGNRLGKLGPLVKARTDEASNDSRGSSCGNAKQTARRTREKAAEERGKRCLVGIWLRQARNQHQRWLSFPCAARNLLLYPSHSFRSYHSAFAAVYATYAHHLHYIYVYIAEYAQTSTGHYYYYDRCGLNSCIYYMWQWARQTYKCIGVPIHCCH